MKLIIDIPYEIVKKGFEEPLTDEERKTIIRSVGNAVHCKERPQDEITNEDIQYAIKEGFDNGYEMAKAKYERPQGEWINHRNDYGHNIADCSECGKAMQWHDEDEDGIPRYCWYCGAKMQKGD